MAKRNGVDIRNRVSGTRSAVIGSALVATVGWGQWPREASAVVLVWNGSLGSSWYDGTYQSANLPYYTQSNFDWIDSPLGLQRSVPSATALVRFSPSQTANLGTMNLGGFDPNFNGRREVAGIVADAGLGVDANIGVDTTNGSPLYIGGSGVSNLGSAAINFDTVVWAAADQTWNATGSTVIRFRNSLVRGSANTVTKTGSGTTEILGSASALSLTVDIAEGTVALGHATGLGPATANLSSQGTLQLNTTGGVGRLLGSGTVTSGPGATPVSLTFGSSGDGSFSGRILNQLGSAPLGITKTGNGTQTFSGAHTFTGPTIVSAGDLELTTSVSTADNGVRFSSGVTVSSTGTLLVSARNAYAGFNPGLPTLRLNSGGVATTSNGVAVTIDRLSLAGGTLASGTPDPALGSWVVRGSITATGAITSNVTATNVSLANVPVAVTVDIGSILRVTGNFTGAGTLIKQGPGTLLLLASNNHTGGTTVGAGILQLGSNTTGGTLSGPVAVSSGATLRLQRSADPVTSVRTLDGQPLSLTGTVFTPAVASVATVTATLGAARTSQPLLTLLTTLSINNNGAAFGSRQYYGVLNLGTNDGIIRNTPFAELRDMARAFVTSGGITGLGASGFANTRLAVIPNTTGTSGVPYFSEFDGVAVGVTDVLLRFTYIGDTDLSGTLDGRDLANLIEGLSTGATGWQNGDFNYDGLVNAADFTLFNTSLAAYNISPFSLGSPSNLGSAAGGTVPEPASAGLLSPLLVALVRRTRRKPYFPASLA